MPKKNYVYGNYKPETLQEAVAEYRSGKLSLRKTAAKYKIPRSSISDHALGKITYESAGKPPTIPAKVEEAIVQNAFTACERGLGLSRHQMMIKAGQVCKSLKIKTPFKGGIPGRDWYRGLNQRFPEIAIRKPAKLSASRSRLDYATVEDYFQKLTGVLHLNQIVDPNYIWNMDEKSISLEHKPQSVVSRKGTRQVLGKVSNNRETITVVAAVNANGGKVPPLVIVKGKTHRSLQAYGTDEGPQDAVWTYQSNAYIEDVLGVQWFSGVFLKNCGDHRPQLLILDQHKSHEVTGLLEKAQEENILILAIPSHSSHWLQPLDKGDFGPLEKIYNTLCSEYTSTTVWPKVFKSACEQALTVGNIQSGFRTTGIFPLNPKAVPDRAFAPSCVPYVTDPLPNVAQLPQSDGNVTADHTLLPASLPLGTAEETRDRTLLLAPLPLETMETRGENAFMTLADVSLRADVGYVHVVTTSPSATVTSATCTSAEDMEVEGNQLLPVLETPSKGLASVVDLPIFPDLPEGSCVNVSNTSSSWNTEIENIFLPQSDTIMHTNKPQKKPITITKSRLLTSAEIVEEKQRKDKEKEKKKQEAAERKKKREAKQQSQMLQQLLQKLVERQ